MLVYAGAGVVLGKYGLEGSVGPLDGTMAPSLSAAAPEGGLKPQVGPGRLVLRLFHPCYGSPTLAVVGRRFFPFLTIRRTSVKCQYFQEKLLDPGAANRRQGEERGIWQELGPEPFTHGCLRRPQSVLEVPGPPPGEGPASCPPT